MLNPADLEMASQTKVWRTWHAVSPLPIASIDKGYLDDCRDHGITAPDRIELVAADGLVTLVVGEFSSHGVGFLVLEPRRTAKTFEPRRTAKAPTAQDIAKREPDAGPVVTVTKSDLTPEQIANGWTAQSLAEYMRRDGINAVAN